MVKKLKATIDGVGGKKAERRAPASPTGRPASVASSAPTEEPRGRPIGVFDSGVGGLTVLHELLVQLPHEDFLYLADTARFPTATARPAELEAFALEFAEELLARRIKLLVVACNSATAAALPALRARLMETTLGIDVLGVVQPGRRAGGGGDAQRPRRPARHAGHGRERRLRARDRGRRPVRRRSPRSRART